MKIIKNKTARPVRVALGRGKVLHLGPSKTAQVSAQASESAAVRKLIDAGTIEIMGEGSGSSAPAPEKEAQVRESTQGHPQPNVVMPKGNR